MRDFIFATYPSSTSIVAASDETPRTIRIEQSIFRYIHPRIVSPFRLFRAGSCHSVPPSFLSFSAKTFVVSKVDFCDYRVQVSIKDTEFYGISVGLSTDAIIEDFSYGVVVNFENVKIALTTGQIYIATSILLQVLLMHIMYP